MTVLDEAASLVDGDRQGDYGHPRDSHGATARMWAAYLWRRFGVELDVQPRDVCWLMVLQKCSRDAHAPKRDNLVDAAGYVRNAEMVDEVEA